MDLLVGHRKLIRKVKTRLANKTSHFFSIEIISNRLFQENDFIYDNYECQSALNKSQLKELLQLASLDNHFLFDGEIYNQIDDVAMGSPLGPTLAMAIMCYMEEQWLADSPLEF